MDYIRDVVISLSSTRNKAAKFGRDIFNYEKRIAEITPDLANLQNPITTYNAVSLAELKLTTSTVSLTVFFCSFANKKKCFRFPFMTFCKRCTRKSAFQKIQK